MVKKIFYNSLFLTLLSLTSIVMAQKQYPINYFSSPLHIPLYLSGTFGELRNNHLHSGVDIRTQEKEGFIVYAPANGYVSRIKVSAWGFGNALYITHPNGYVTVYGHLKAFNPAIIAYLRKIQYEKESFEQDLAIPKYKIRIKKGDTIAVTGNTGGSEGPHLHYEIRDEKTEKPINPLLFGLKVEDTLLPIIQSIKIYTEDVLHDKVLEVKKKDHLFSLKSIDTLLVPAKFSLGIATYDVISNTTSKKGIYQLELYVDTLLYYQHTLETFSFTESRYINCLINYPDFIKTGVKYQQTKILPGNKLSLYNKHINNGWIELKDNLVHKLRYNVLDVNGNCSELVFYVKKDSSMQKIPLSPLPIIDSNLLISYNKIDTFCTEEVKVKFPAEALYEDILMKYASYPAPSKYYSKFHEIHNIYTPLHKNISLSIKTDTVADSLQSKLLIVRIKDDNSIIAEGGKYENGFIKTNINNFGKFAVLIDTIAPTIKPLNFKDKTNISKLKTLEIKITDNLSGITKYKATLNDKWILMEFDGKNNLLTYTIDNKILEGSNLLKVVVEDSRQNVSELSFELIKKVP
ncbi:MAG: M23 family metallopeptidase [Bacteroidetes bacterium]|nr:M23 family metallopeptidase [Bacteroidota bacterium]